MALVVCEHCKGKGYIIEHLNSPVKQSERRLCSYCFGSGIRWVEKEKESNELKHKL